MRNYGRILAVFLLAAVILSANAWAGKKAKTETYQNIDKIRINTVSGDCIINKGDGDQVTIEVVNSYRPRDSFEPKIKDVPHQENGCGVRPRPFQPIHQPGLPHPGGRPVRFTEMDVGGEVDLPAFGKGNM